MIWCTELSNHERYNVIVSNITNFTQLFLCLLEAAFKIHLAQKSEKSKSLCSQVFLQTPDLDLQTNAKCTFICKDDFGPLSNSPLIFLLSPGKMLLTMFLFQKSPASVHSLWSSPKCLNRLCLTVFIIPVACAPFPAHFLLSSQLCIYYALILCALCKQPHLSGMTFCDYPLCGGCQWLPSGPLSCQHSSLFLWFQRTSETRNLHCRDGHLSHICNIFLIKISKNH